MSQFIISRSAPALLTGLLFLVLTGSVAALPAEETSSFAQACRVLVARGCAMDTGRISALTGAGDGVDSWSLASAALNGGIRAASSSRTDNAVAGAPMEVEAVQTTAYDIHAGSLEPGTPVTLQIQLGLEGRLLAGSFPYGSAGVVLLVKITREGFPSVLTVFNGSAGAGGSGLPIQWISSGDFVDSDFDVVPGLGHVVNMQRSLDLTALVGHSSFSVSYSLSANSSGQGYSSFENTGQFSMRSLTDGVSVTAVPEPNTALLFAGGLAMLGASGRRGSQIRR